VKFGADFRKRESAPFSTSRSYKAAASGIGAEFAMRLRRTSGDRCLYAAGEQQNDEDNQDNSADTHSTARAISVVAAATTKD
jgi:hypothetical protein